MSQWGVNRIVGSVDPPMDGMDQGPLREPAVVVGGHKVYRRDSCTHDHTPVRARRYFGLWQCAACYGIIAPELRRLRLMRWGAHTSSTPNGNGGHA